MLRQVYHCCQLNSDYDFSAAPDPCHVINASGTAIASAMDSSRNATLPRWPNWIIAFRATPPTHQPSTAETHTEQLHRPHPAEEPFDVQAIVGAHEDGVTKNQRHKDRMRGCIVDDGPVDIAGIKGWIWLGTKDGYRRDSVPMERLRRTGFCGG